MPVPREAPRSAVGASVGGASYLRPGVRLGTASLGLFALACSAAGSDASHGGGASQAPTGDASVTGDGSSQASDASLTGDRAEANADDGDQDADVALSCATTSVDHSASCPAGACAIVDDLALNCNGGFAGVGVRVAPAPDATWLATSWTGDPDATYSQPAIFRIAQGEAIYQAGIPAPAAAYAPISLALSPEGEPSFVSAVTLRFGTADADGLGAVEFLSHAASGWSSSYITMPYGDTVYDMEIGTDGTPHVWMSSSGPTYLHATRDGSGTWTVASAPTVDGSGEPRFTLTRDGQPAALDFVSMTNGYPGFPWQLATVTGGSQTALGSPSTPPIDTVFGVSVTHAISPVAPLSAARLGAAFQGSDAIHVVWLQDQGSTEETLPDTPPVTKQCPSLYDNGCPAPCHETAVGLENNLLALAWTADGVGWVAYVVTHYDQQLHFTLSTPCSGDGCAPGPECNRWVDSDSTSYVLHVARVPSDGTLPSDVLSVPVASPFIISTGSPARILDARAFGTNLALGIMTTNAPNAATLRVLRIDTTRFASDGGVSDRGVSDGGVSD